MKVSKSRLLATAVVLMIFISLFSMISIAEPSFVDVDAYGLLEGVLHSDSYTLYPYEEKSLDIGFSKYGEMISKDACPTCASIGLNYDKVVDPFANENVSMTEWNEGWLMNITYEYEDEDHHVWAFALFSDFRAIEGEWINNATGPLDARDGYKGGRKTNGYAITDPMEVLYDGPRRCVVLLHTRIFDWRLPNPKDPEDPKGIPLVDVYIQIVFNKVKKYVLLIKDIKLTTESKLLEKVQVKFGQRGEWDLGDDPEPWMPRSYAHFYHALPTKYYKHPWYMADGYYTGYDLCQIIGQGEEYVAWAAYWPELMSHRVEAISKLTREDKLTDLSDWTHMWEGEEGTYDEYWMEYYYLASVPGYYQDALYYPNCEFPPYWTYAEPEVYVDGTKQTEGVHYSYDIEWGEPGGYDRPSPGVEDEEIPGTFWLYLYSYPGDEAEVYVHWKLHAHQDDMSVEARTPYTMAEWVFDLSYDDVDLPTHQFRCITVYGVTDLNDGEDWDMGGEAMNIIDSEVMYQLDEIFNPWDLRQAVGQESWADWGGMWDCDWGYAPEDSYRRWHVRDCWPGKNTERWVEFFTGDGEEDTFYLPQQIVVPGPYDDPISAIPDWDQYCSPREKVLVDGVLQTPGGDPDEDDYEIYWDYRIEETLEEGPADIEDGDCYDLMYPRIIPGSEFVWFEDEWGDIWDLTYWTGVYWDIDYSNGKLYLWDDFELDEDESIGVDYDLYFPAAYIEFYEDSVPDEDEEIKVLYSTFRIVYKTDKFIPGIDGLRMEDGDDYMFGAPEDFGFFFLRYGPLVPEYFLEWTVHGYLYRNWIQVWVKGYDEYGPYEYEPEWELLDWYGLPAIGIYGYGEVLFSDEVVEVTYPIFAGRYEWTSIGTETGPADSMGASMVTEGFRQWKNFDTKISGLDYMRSRTPDIPYLFRNVTGPAANRDNYYDDHMAETVEEEAGRAHLKDDWCTTLPVASSNIITIGGLYPNMMSEYFNDFTSVYYNRIGEDFGSGFYSHACWGRNFYENTEDKGYAQISTYKDLNGTIGFIVWGVTGDDTYYACYALQHGLLEIMQWLQPGVTSLVLEFNYTVHPSDDCFFHIVECLGTFTECGGFDYVMWDMMEFYDDDLMFKLIMNSYSSEYWVFHIQVDFDVEKFWHLPDLYAIAVTYPQYIYFHWDPTVHPDP